jgi:hypothetical protein
MRTTVPRSWRRGRAACWCGPTRRSTPTVERSDGSAGAPTIGRSDVSAMAPPSNGRGGPVCPPGSFFVRSDKAFGGRARILHASFRIRMPRLRAALRVPHTRRPDARVSVVRRIGSAEATVGVRRGRRRREARRDAGIGRLRTLRRSTRTRVVFHELDRVSWLMAHGSWPWPMVALSRLAISHSISHQPLATSHHIPFHQNVRAGYCAISGSGVTSVSPCTIA